MSGARTELAAGQLEAGPFGSRDVPFGPGGSPADVIMAELDAVESRSYGQFCGLVRAVEVVGERWAPLIIRDLLVSPKTAAQLCAGLPRIPVDLLMRRLRELDGAGVVRRVESDGVVRYEMTEYGAELDDIIMRFARWGTRMLDQPKPGEITTTDSVMFAMRSTFQPAAAVGLRVTFELRLGTIVLGLRISDGALEVVRGSVAGADLVIELRRSLKGLLMGEVDPVLAVEDGSVGCDGDPALLGLFVRLFHMRTPPQET